MSELHNFQGQRRPQLEESIIGQVNYLVKQYEVGQIGSELGAIPVRQLSNFMQAVLYRLTASNNGCHELCNLVRSLSEDGEIAFSCNFTYSTDNDDPCDSLHISNVPRIKELNNHVFSTLQKGQDLF
jgi:hypothetical protein